jgi:hypothetical protein
MKPFEAAARFAAYTWYTGSHQNQSPTVAAEARRFTSENWQAFLPLADEGWGSFSLCRQGPSGPATSSGTSPSTRPTETRRFKHGPLKTPCGQDCLGS